MNHYITAISMVKFWCFLFFIPGFVVPATSQEPTKPAGTKQGQIEATGEFLSPRETIRYQLWINDAFSDQKPDKEPMLKDGRPIGEQVYRYMKYPPQAREQGIQGKVILTLTIDEAGMLQEVLVKKGIGGGCDEDAVRAIRLLGDSGFTPAYLQGVPVKSRFDLPMRYLLR